MHAGIFLLLALSCRCAHATYQMSKLQRPYESWLSEKTLVLDDDAKKDWAIQVNKLIDQFVDTYSVHGHSPFHTSAWVNEKQTIGNMVGEFYKEASTMNAHDCNQAGTHASLSKAKSRSPHQDQRRDPGIAPEAFIFAAVDFYSRQACPVVRYQGNNVKSCRPIMLYHYMRAIHHKVTSGALGGGLKQLGPVVKRMQNKLAQLCEDLVLKLYQLTTLFFVYFDIYLTNLSFKSPVLSAFLSLGVAQGSTLVDKDAVWQLACAMTDNAQQHPMVPDAVPVQYGSSSYVDDWVSAHSSLPLRSAESGIDAIAVGAKRGFIKSSSTN